jgi:hypothetical protein
VFGGRAGYRGSMPEQREQPDPTAGDAAAVGCVVKHELLREWQAQVVSGHLTVTGLVQVRSRLDPSTGEFRCRHSLALLAYVIEQLAPLRGIKPVEDNLYAVALDNDLVWSGGVAERLIPDTPEDIDWQRPPGRW